MNILLMEDDVVLSDILLDFLRESWDVDYAYDSKEVYERLESKKYDLFVFDVNVPGKDGLKLLQELRSYSDNTPTIFITARTETAYLKKAFEIGACDYVKKPFELEELNARILNAKRLFHIDSNETLEISNGVLFSPVSRTLLKDGVKISLGSKDARLLSYFLNNKKRLLSSEELAQNVWDFDSLPSDATLRSHIRTIREAIGKERISTVRAEGYVYE